MLMLVCIAAFYGVVSSRVFANLRIATIGGMCYSIYLLHNYVITGVGFLTERAGQTLPFEARLAIQMLLITPIVLTVSVVYYRWIEQPCMHPDWPARLKQLAVDRWRTETLASASHVYNKDQPPL